MTEDPAFRTAPSMTLNQLQVSIHAWATSKGWWDEGKQKTFIEACMLVVSELAEAVEEFRKGHGYAETYYVTDENGVLKPEGIPSEISDAIIRLLDLSEFFNIPVDIALPEKMMYNSSRPYRHGDKHA